MNGLRVAPGIRFLAGTRLFQRWGSHTAVSESKGMAENVVCRMGLLDGVPDSYGGLTVEVKESMDPSVFSPMLEASIKGWKQQGKKGVWIKLPIEQSNLVHSVVQQGFRYHHAESNYVMLVRWLADGTPDSLPANASHRVGIGAFVLNDKNEVLVVQENSGKFKGTDVWKLPTGVVNEGEDIWKAAAREVKEETGIETEFIEVLTFRQSHRSFHTKSDLMFVCLLRPSSTNIDKDDGEIAAAKWMSVEEYIGQPFVRENKQFYYIAKICAKKAAEGDAYPGLGLLAATSRTKTNYIYCHNPESLL
ncbi:hypothetical protein MLD38_028182 [Melastoma candidum]|uniref:Uncharacterized protein n=1 Tax=Melastoma candidum TaxID=119954 RepID=A0ACB9N0T6_9MYRT|nr:hypothetical protein MLD38_028182 [Melastoma candidum]